MGNDLPIVLISGPCQIESLEHTLKIAAKLVSVCEKQSVKLIFKAFLKSAIAIRGAAGTAIASRFVCVSV